MENQEVLDLLKIIEESGRHGTTFSHIRAEATRQLMEIEAELTPEKEEPESVEVDGVVGDNPPPRIRLEADNIDNDEDGVIDEANEVEPIETDPAVQRRP